MNADLKGKVALVTGAGNGIGLEIARVYAHNGAKVAFADIDFGSAQRAASLTPGAKAIPMDVTSEESIEAGFAAVLREFGRLDILVNNAGVNSPTECRVTIDRFPTKEWDRVLAVDLKGVFLATRAAARIMILQRSGRIINISSVMGIVPARLQCAFTAAKAAVVNLTRSTAIELAQHGILANCIAPGSMENTGLYNDGSANKERGRKILNHVPMDRPGTFDDVAYAALFLAAPPSGYITGQTLCVDGGWTVGAYSYDSLITAKTRNHPHHV